MLGQQQQALCVVKVFVNHLLAFTGVVSCMLGTYEAPTPTTQPTHKATCGRLAAIQEHIILDFGVTTAPVAQT